MSSSQQDQAESEPFLFSRQPIVTGERRLIGWDFSFATAEGQLLSGSGDCESQTLAAITGFAQSAHWDSVLSGVRAFLPASRQIVFSDVLETLPRNRFWLALPPMEEVPAALSNRLYDLHSRFGIRLAFLGYSRRDAREQLLELADIVVVDAFGNDEEIQQRLIRRAQRRSLQVMAAGIEHGADFERLRDGGYELFSGGSYSEHSSDLNTQASVDGKLLLELLIETHGELEIEEVSKRVTANPVLEEGLLRLVNSLELARAQKIENVGQALIMIGAKGLSRWLNLLLFQVGTKDGARGPLFRVAASRARLMELMAVSTEGDSEPARKERGETAFLIGILSLVHVLLGVDRKNAIGDLSLPEEMAEALMNYSGSLGRMLRLAECLDAGEFVEVGELASELAIPPDSIWNQQTEAFDWVMRMV